MGHSTTPIGRPTDSIGAVDLCVTAMGFHGPVGRPWLSCAWSIASPLSSYGCPWVTLGRPWASGVSTISHFCVLALTSPDVTDVTRRLYSPMNLPTSVHGSAKGSSGGALSRGRP